MGVLVSENLLLDTTVARIPARRTLGRGILLALLLCSLSLRAQNAADNGADAIDELVLLLQSQLSDARARNGALATEIETVNQALDNSRAAYEQMTAELVTRDESILALRRELDAAREQVKGRSEDQDELRGLATAVVDLEAAKRRLEDENTIIQGRIRDLQRGLEGTEAQLVAAREESERLSDQAAVPQARLAELESKLDDMRDVEARRKATMDGLLSQVAELQRARETEREKLELLTAERDIAREEIGLVQTELTASEEALQNRQRELEALQASVQVERDRQQELSGQVAAKSAALDRMAADNAELQSRMHRLTGTDEERQRAMDELLSRLATLEDDAAHTRDLLAVTRQERDAALDERVSLKAELAAAREEAERLSDPGHARLAELETKLENMRDVEAQRKETMDDLFRQLAELRRARQTDREKLELLEAERDIARDETGLVRTELEASEEALQVRQRELEVLQVSVQDERNRQQELSGQVAAKAAALEQAAADFKALEGRMQRLTGTDEQRRRAMDELLTRLATLEEEVRHTQDLLTTVRRERDAALDESAGLKAELERARSVHEQTAGGLEQAAKTAQAARDELAERLGRHEVEARRLTAQVEALETEITRFQVLDSQRRATMDSLMLDLAQAQDRSRALAAELEALQAEPAGPSGVPDPAQIENLQSQIQALETRNRDLQRTLDAATTRVQGEDQDGLPAPDAALQAGLIELHAENERLRQDLEAQRRQIDALEAAGREERGDLRVDDPQASVALREQWEREHAEMNVRIKQLSLQRESDEADLQQFRETVDELRADNTRLRAEVDQLQRVKADIQRDSDLFRSIEQTNIELREKAAESDAERMRAQRTLAEIEAQSATLVGRLAAAEKDVESLRHALAVAGERDGEQRELIETLMVQMPVLEEQVGALDRVRSELEATLAERNNALDTLRVELEKREHRLQQAERVAQVLEQTREEVSRSVQRERRDMHYNMAAVYAREGRLTDAEAEYLRALELDPADADVHYNLGILYDDELKSPERATLHYRRYLRLRPHGEDADAVRNWLRRIEMAPAGR